jgi:spore maturation protein CgeB
MRIAMYWGDEHTLPGKCDDIAFNSFYNSGWKDGFESLNHTIDYFTYNDNENRQGYDLYIYGPGFLSNKTMKKNIYSPNIFFTEKLAVAQSWAVAHSFHFDNICFLDYTNFASLRALGIKNCWWVPGAYNPKIFRDIGLERKFNCMFLGNYDTEVIINNKHTRIDYIRHIDSLPTAMVGRGYYAANANRMWNAAKVGIDVPIAEFCSSRLMQVMGSGTFCLTRKPRIETGISYLLDHYATYNDVYDLANVVKYWVDHEEARLDRVKRAHELVNKKHTFSQRARQLLMIAGLMEKDPSLFFIHQ